jgi:hypothetical protein
MSLASEQSFNIAATAGFYSQLAGVLAGFAFAAIMVLLTARMTPSQSQSSGVPPFSSATRVLVVSFVGLVLASLNYAVLAGDVPGKPRSATLELVGGVGFGAAGLLLLYAMVLTFDDVSRMSQQAHADSVGNFLRTVLSTVITPLILLFIYLGVQDFNYASRGSGVYAVDIFSWILVAMQVGFGIVEHFRFRNVAIGDSARDRSIRIIAVMSIVLIVVASVSFALLAALLFDSAQAGPKVIPYIAILTAFAGAIGYTRHLSRTRP